MIRPVRLLPIALVSVAIAHAQLSEAGTIQITIGTKVHVTRDMLHVELDVRNSGDEAAFALTPSVLFRGTESVGAAAEALGPSSSHALIVDVRVDDVARQPGLWPLFVRLAYSDANKHSFEAVHVATVQIGAATPERGVTLRLAGTSLRTSGQIVATIDAIGTPRHLRITFFGPSSLTLVPQSSELPAQVPARSTVAATVTNAGATPSSRLPVFAVAEYDAAANSRMTVVSAATIGIESDQSPVDVVKIVWVVMAALLVGWLVIAVPSLIRKKSGDAS